MNGKLRLLVGLVKTVAVLVVEEVSYQLLIVWLPLMGIKTLPDLLTLEIPSHRHRSFQLCLHKPGKTLGA
jgi:hypothetical protein